jgi:aminoglycoside phosphotransferase (APT) family kinase protein
MISHNYLYIALSSLMDTRPDYIADQVLDYLTMHADYKTPLTVEKPIQVLEMKWSAIYFLNLISQGQPQKIVVKVSRYPEQQRIEESWQTDHLIDRGVREYKSLVCLYEHFQAHGDGMLTAVRPITFIRQLNGIVMEFFDGPSFYRSCMRPKHMLAADGRQRAEKLLYRAGEWLRIFHTIAMPDAADEPDRVFSPALARQLLLEAVGRLQQQGVDPTRWHNWTALQSMLEKSDSDERVWIHNDFHMGNVRVLSGDRILGFDTGLDKRDHPYSDVGKFLADIQSRGARILSFGLLPSNAGVETFRQQFLDGYLQGRELQPQLLALYEGQYLFEKWEASLVALMARFPKGTPTYVQRLICNRTINPTFTRILQHWAKRH